MKNATKLRKLLKEWSRDPRLKQVIAKARRGSSHDKRESQIESLANVYLALSTIAAGLSKKKKARALEEHIDVVYFLVQVGLLLKEHIFDRPEVKDFFNRSAQRIYQRTQASLGTVTAKRKRPRPARPSR
jgi:hypothetical protein